MLSYQAIARGFGHPAKDGSTVAEDPFLSPSTRKLAQVPRCAGMRHQVRAGLASLFTRLPLSVAASLSLLSEIVNHPQPHVAAAPDRFLECATALLDSWHRAGWLPSRPDMALLAPGDRSLTNVPIAVAVRKPGQPSSIIYARSQAGAYLAAPVNHPVSSALGARRTSDALRTWLVLAHEAAHTVYMSDPAPFRLSQDSMSALERAINMLLMSPFAPTNVASRAHNEILADVRATMMLLENAGHTAPAIREVELFADMRAANSAYHAAHCSQPDEYPTASAIRITLASLDQWRGCPVSDLMAHSRIIASRAWWHLHDPDPDSAMARGKLPKALAALVTAATARFPVNLVHYPLSQYLAMAWMDGSAATVLSELTVHYPGHPHIAFWNDRLYAGVKDFAASTSMANSLRATLTASECSLSRRLEACIAWIPCFCADHQGAFASSLQRRKLRTAVKYMLNEVVQTASGRSPGNRSRIISN